MPLTIDAEVYAARRIEVRANDCSDRSEMTRRSAFRGLRTSARDRHSVHLTRMTRRRHNPVYAASAAPYSERVETTDECASFGIVVAIGIGSSNPRSRPIPRPSCAPRPSRRCTALRLSPRMSYQLVEPRHEELRMTIRSIARFGASLFRSYVVVNCAP